MVSIMLSATFSTVPRTFAMARALSQRGHMVTLLEWDRERAKPPEEIKEGVRFRRFRLAAPYGNKASVLLPLWMAFVFIHTLAHRYDVLQPQNLDNLAAVWIPGKIRRTTIVYDLADFYADSYVEGIPVLAALCRMVERRLTRLTDALILVSERQTEQLGTANIPPHWTVVCNSPESLPSRTACEAEPHTRLRLFYGGTLGKGRSELLNVINVVGELDTVELLIAGFGELEHMIRDSTRTLPNVRFIGRVSHDEILRLTSHSDVVVIPLSTALVNFRLTLANKFLESLAFGKPMIVTSGTYMAELSSRYGFGVPVNFDNTDEIKSAILRLRDEKLRADMSRSAETIYSETYSWDLMKKRLQEIYEDALAQLPRQ